jgi:hypothetical protein
LCQQATQVFAVDDAVEEAVTEEEFAGLEAFWQLDANGLLDDFGASEADEGFGLCEDDVA